MNVETLHTAKGTPLAAARTVARLLLPAEDMIDRSIAASSQLLMQMMQARLESGLPASVGHEAMRAASDSVSALVTARGSLLDCHQELTAVRDDLMLDGSDVGCTPSSPSGRVDVPRRRVA